MSRVAEATQAALDLQKLAKSRTIKGRNAAQLAAEAYELSILNDVQNARAEVAAVLDRERLYLRSLPGAVSSPARTRTLSNVAGLEAALACLTTVLKGTPKEPPTGTTEALQRLYHEEASHRQNSRTVLYDRELRLDKRPKRR